MHVEHLETMLSNLQRPNIPPWANTWQQLTRKTARYLRWVGWEGECQREVIGAGRDVEIYHKNHFDIGMFGNFGILNISFLLVLRWATRVFPILSNFKRLNWSFHGGKPFLPVEWIIENIILHLKRSFLKKSCHARLADGCSGCKMILSGVDGHICQPTPCIKHKHTPSWPQAKKLSAMPYSLLLLLLQLIHLPLCSCSSQLLSTLT